MNTLLLNELPQFNGLALQMIWSMSGTFSCLHRDLAADMQQLFQSFAQQVEPTRPEDGGSVQKFSSLHQNEPLQVSAVVATTG